MSALTLNSFRAGLVPVLLRGVLSALLSLWLLGCSSLGGLEEKPRVSVVGLKPVKIELFEQRYAARLRIQNPNKVALGIQGMNYVIEVNGQEFARGVSDQGVTVPAFGETVMQVSIISNLASLLRQLRSVGKDDAPLSYRIHGRIAIQGIPGTIPFSHDGDLRLGRAPTRQQEV
jgi:LEA14-like dessication related protein